MVCMKTSLAIGLLWSVCDMVCNDETSGSSLYLFVSLNVVFETRMQLIIFAHVSVSLTDQRVLQGSWKNQWVILETCQVIVVRLVCSDVRVAGLLCYSAITCNEIETCRHAGEMNFVSAMWRFSSYACLTFNVHCTFWSDEFTCVPRTTEPQTAWIEIFAIWT